MYEKRISGMFLGEILRLATLDLIKNPKVSFFKDENSASNDWRTTTYIDKSSSLYQEWGLDTSIMSVAAIDESPTLSALRQLLESTLQVHMPAYEDALAFKKIAAAIGRRAARLSAVAIAAIVLQTGKLSDPAHDNEPIDIGVDGSLVEHYPYFTDMIYEALRAVDGIGEQGAKRIRIGIASDGSGVGAALIALVAAGMEKSTDNLLGDLRSGAANASDTAASSDSEEKPTAN
jgi:hexokinase